MGKTPPTAHDDVDLPVRERLAVVAMGGNALMPRDEEGTPRQQVRGAHRIAKSLMAIVREGYRVLVVHGNGPQVGRELVRCEESSTKIPPNTLDLNVASTQGRIGYLLEQAIRNTLTHQGMTRRVATVLTQVLVAAQDGAFDEPTKPVGPFYGRWRAREVARSRGTRMVEDAGRGWRQVVASPQPARIMGVEAVEALLATGHLVIAGGGGGVPVSVDARGQLVGMPGVVDKDRTAALFAEELGADLLVFLTPAEQVYLNFGATDQKALDQVTAAELRKHHEDGHFAPGSMGPKIEAALEFLAGGGSAAIITSAPRLAAALADRGGTRITREIRDHTVSSQIDMFPSPDGDRADDGDDPEHDSPEHDSPEHDSPEHDSPEHDSPEHDSPEHDSPERPSAEHDSADAGDDPGPALAPDPHTRPAGAPGAMEPEAT